MLAALIETLRTERPTHEVVTIDGEAISGERLERMARAHAERLIDLGVAAGDRVAVCAPTSPELIAALLAHLRLGVIHVPVNTRYRAPEVRHVLDDSGARASFAMGGASERDPSALELGGLDGAPAMSWPKLPARDAVGLIIYTSGTTGRAKGVVLSQQALAGNLGAMMDLWGIGVHDVVTHALPLFHVHGLGLGLIGPLLRGGRARLYRRFDPAAIVADFGAGRATVHMGVPTMYHRLLEHLDSKPADARALRSARLFTAGSAALPAALLERFRALTGHVILERYGMTETLFTLSNPLAGERRAGTVGRPVPGCEVRIVGDDGAPIAPRPEGASEPGEIEVMSPHLMDGYWGAPETTRAAFRDGWFRSGDVATLDPDGYHRIVGRRSTDIIKSGGFKIGAREIEDTLLDHPSVRAVAVVGLPDARWGELVAAAVVARDDAGEEALSAHCRAHLADYKRPRRFLFVGDLPKNAMGKVVKPEVKRLFD